MADYRDIPYGNGRFIRIPLIGSGRGDPSIGYNKSSQLYGGVGGGSKFYSSSTPSGVYRPIAEQPLGIPGGNTGRYADFAAEARFRPTSAAAGQGFSRLPVNQLPSSGNVFALSGESFSSSGSGPGGPLTRTFNLSGNDYWYHGTGFRNTGSILSSGFASNAGAVDTPSGFHDLWFTKDPAVARAYAGNSGSVFRSKLDPWAADEFGLSTIGKFRSGAEATRIRGTLPFNVFGAETEVSGPRGFFDNFFRRPESFGPYLKPPGGGGAGNGGFPPVGGGGLNPLAGGGGVPRNSFIQNLRSVPFGGLARGTLGLYSALGSGDQERVNSTAIPSLLAGGLFKGVDRALTEGTKTAIRAGQTSIPFVGNNLSLATKEFTLNGTKFYPNTLLNNGAPIKPFQFGKALGFSNLIQASLLGYDATRALSGDPLASRQGTTNLGAGLVGLGTFYGVSAGLASTGIGAVPAALLAGGASILTSSGAGAALGLRPLTKYEARAQALENTSRTFLSSGLDLGGAGSAKRFGTQDVTKALNPLQAGATAASVLIDSIFQIPAIVNAPTKLTGATSPDDVRQLYGELVNRAKGGAGEFSGLTPGGVASELLKFGGKTGPVGNIADIITRGGKGEFLDRLIRDTDSLIEDSAGALKGGQRYTYIEAQKIDRDLGVIQSATKLSQLADAKRQNIVQNYRKETLKVAPPRTLESYDFRTGQVRRYEHQQTLGDVISGAANKLFTEAGRFFSRGEREGLSKQSRIYKGAAEGAANRINSIISTANQGKLDAYKQILGTPASKRATVAKNLTNRQLNAGGGGGGGYVRRNYEAQYQARQAQQRAERGFNAAVRLVPQKFEEGLSALTPLELTTQPFDYRSVNAAVSDVLPGQANAADFLKQYDAAYQGQLSAGLQSLTSDRDAVQKRINEIRGGQQQYVSSLQGLLKKAPTPEARFNIESAISRTNTDANREINKLIVTFNKLQKGVQSAAEQFDPNRQNSFSYFVAQTAKVAQSESRFLQGQAIQGSIQGIRDEKYQLEQDRRLGLVSSARFIREDARLDREELGKQYKLYKLQLGEKETEIANLKDVLQNGYKKADGTVVPADPSLASQAAKLQSDYDLFKTERSQYFNSAYERLSDDAINKKVNQLKEQEFATGFQPFYEAVFSGAQTGTSPFGKLGALFSKQTSGLTGGATSSILSDLLSGPGSKGAGDIVKNFFSGNQKDFTDSLVKNLGSRPRFAAGFGTTGLANKTLAYGAAGYTASQYLANYLSPYQNSAVGGIGSTVGGLLGSAFGPVGSFVGSAAGGLIGALPFTQNPVGGAATGGLLGALGGFAFGGPIGAVVGGLAGGLFGLFGGKQSQQKKAEDKARKEAERQARLQRQAQGRDFARSDLRGGIDYAQDLFSGYGNYADRENALNDYLSAGAFNARAGGKIFDSDTLSAAQSEFARLTPLFNPIKTLADQYKPVISRPGAFQGQLFDIGLTDQQRAVNAGPFSSGPINQLTSTFQSLQSSLGQYGFDATRAQKAYNIFAGQYQSQLREVDYNISQAERNYYNVGESNRLSRLSRGIDRDVLNKRVSDFDRDSRFQIEDALGTLQRRENRAAIVDRLKTDQQFDKGILLRQQDLFNQQDTFQTRQEFYQQSDALKGLDDLIQSRKILQEGFGDFSTRLTNASDEFYQMSEAIKEVNRQLDLLSRNLR